MTAPVRGGAAPKRPDRDPAQQRDPSEPLGGRAFAEQLPNDTDPTGRRLPQSLSSTDQSGTGPHAGRVSPYVDNLAEPAPRREPRDVDVDTEAEARLRESVERELDGERRLEGATIEVAVVGSEVTLLGRVPGRGLRNIAENIAQAVPGVTAIDNQLEVESGEVGIGSGDAGDDDA